MTEPLTDPLAEARAKAVADRDAQALAAYIEYTSITDRFERARAMSRLGIATISRGHDLARAKGK